MPLTTPRAEAGRGLHDRPWIIPVALTGLALAVRLAFIPFWWDLTLGGDEEYYWNMAVGLAGGQRFPADFFLRPPLWGSVLSGVAALAPHPAYGRLLTTLLGTAMVPALYLLAFGLFSRRVAIVAAVLCAVYPDYVGYSHYLWSEMFFTVISVAAALLFAKTFDGGIRPWMLLLVSGVLGLFWLAKESAVLLFAALMITAIRVPRGRRVRQLTWATLLFVVPAFGYSVFGSYWNGRVIVLSDAPFYNANQVEHGRATWQMTPQENQRMFVRDVEHRVVELPRVYPAQLFNLWTPNSFVVHRLMYAPENFGNYGVAHPRPIAVGVAVANVLVILLGLTGLLVAESSPFKTYALSNLGLLSLSPVVFLMCSRFRVPFMFLLMLYAALVLADPGLIRRRTLGPVAWGLWAAAVLLFAAIVTAKWSTLGQWG